MIDDFAGEARTMGLLEAGSFVGELNLLIAQALYLSTVVREAGEVLLIPSEKLKEVVTEESALSDTILKTFLARHSIGMRAGLGLRIIGSRPLRGRNAPQGVRGTQPASPRLDRTRARLPEREPCSSVSVQGNRRHRWRSGRARTC